MWTSFVPLLIAVPVLIGLGAVLLQETGEVTMRLANIVQLGIKELRGLLRDPMLMVLIVYAFTVSIYTGSKAMPGDAEPARRSRSSTRTARRSRRGSSPRSTPPYFSVPKLISQQRDGPADGRRASTPSRSTSRRTSSATCWPARSPTIQLNIDATRMTQAFSGGGYIQSIVTSEVNEFLSSPPRRRQRAGRPRAAGAVQSAAQQGLVRRDQRADHARSPCCRSSSPARR